jgi:hypothetical protein
MSVPPPYDAKIGMYAASPQPSAPPKTHPFVPLRDASSLERKMMPVASGVLDYFPDALSAVAYISYLGNQKHNPGEPLHWARGKSDDHIDCAARHMLRRTELDQDGIMEAAEMVWRSLAWLQLEIERKFHLPPSPGSTT